jgi:hypothetical protein
VAIFDRLPYEGFEAFIRVAICIGIDEIENREGYHQSTGERPQTAHEAEEVTSSFRLAFFNADTILYHLLVPADLVTTCVPGSATMTSWTGPFGSS